MIKRLGVSDPFRLEDMLACAIQIAAEAHRHQFDKAGQPYILHPISVMEACETLEEKIVAILHDLLEDTAWTAEALVHHGFPQHLVDAIVALTRVLGEPYGAYIERVGNNRLATIVKLHDLGDNLRDDRLDLLENNTRIRLMNKYLPAQARLQTRLEEYDNAEKTQQTNHDNSAD